MTAASLCYRAFSPPRGQKRAIGVRFEKNRRRRHGLLTLVERSEIERAALRAAQLTSNLDHQAWIEVHVLVSPSAPERAIALRIAHDPRSTRDIIATLVCMAMHP